MTVPMIDLREQHAGVAAEIEAGLLTVMDSCHFILGPQVAAFEEEAAAFLGVAHAVSCASGTDALHLALRGLGVGPGDEVITTAFTFFATIEAIHYVGARPVFVDIDPRTFNIDPAKVSAAVTPATRAILPVHLFGQTAAMESLLDIAARHDLAVVEDCAQAFGSRRGGKAAGTFGDIGCFSFFPTKNLGAYGDGGMLTTDSAELASALKDLRNHGSHERHHHEGIGFNSRLDEMQAVVLRAKLKRVERYNLERRRVAQRYNQALADLPDLVMPWADPEGYHVYNQYTLQAPDRDALCASLQQQGIGFAVHYPKPLYQQPAIAADHPQLFLPMTENMTQHCLSVPLYPEMSDAHIDQVIGVLRRSLESQMPTV